MAERRPDPTVKGSKKTYTREQFDKFYGKQQGKLMWKKGGQLLGSKSGAEKRRDPTTPKSKKTYTRDEFIQFYGGKQGQKMWSQAAPKKGAEPAKKFPKIQLHYWNGRGLMEVPRMMLAMRNKFPPKDYEDLRYSTEVAEGTVKSYDDVKDKLSTNLGRMPTMTVNGKGIGQSAAINGYLATELGFMGKTSVDAARVISIQEHLKEMMTAFRGICPYGKEPSAEDLTKWFESGVDDSEGAADMKTRAERFLKWWLARIEKVVGAKGFAVGSRTTLADLLIYNIFAETLKDSEAPEGYPAWKKEPMGSKEKMDKALEATPKLKKICDNVGNNKKIQKWLETRGLQKF